MDTPLTPEQIERGGRACYRVWTASHAKPPAWEALPDHVREKYRVLFLAALREVAIPDDGLRLPKRQFDGIGLRERMRQKRLAERRTA